MTGKNICSKPVVQLGVAARCQLHLLALYSMHSLQIVNIIGRLV